ncbi:lipase-like PAD4 [Tripterygium wilfordii]|uniref:lipase-like PAD4 n=1 Tax=Tripterygium wilfordii TaxID=458696 RepID=UPI0018F82B30|nr:lipase-like PAD4 [Tripterygium wilfordii]
MKRKAETSLTMGIETSPFESSEMLASFLASTPLLEESWRLCDRANASPGQAFLIEQVGSRVYVAFSGVQYLIQGSDPSFGNLVSLDGVSEDFLAPLHYRNEGEEPVMVHAGLLHLFISSYQAFKTQMSTIREKCKSIVITGHSIGGGTASLAALWLLSLLQSESSSLPVLCITFGSPLLGNESLSRAIARERWGGNFCHAVSKHDLMPRLLFAPVASITSQLHCLLQFWHLSMHSPQYRQLADQLSGGVAPQIFENVLTYLGRLTQAGGSLKSVFSPFGNYFFCSEEGAICIENAASVIKMMQLMLVTSSPICSIEDHLKYGDYVSKISLQILNKTNFMQGDLPKSSDEAGVALALQSAGILNQEPIASPAKDCLKMARQMGLTPSLNCAKLAIKLSKINPYRAEIEWYKACCDSSDDQLGYYDSFKLRRASKRDSKVNMNRHKLAQFWDHVIRMLDNNQLPHDFHRHRKWVNGSQFYMLLVEPLDIAEYYRTRKHHVKGHYIDHGRERRYKIFDSWWKNRKVTDEENSQRSRFASATQDTCFWAKVEQARDRLDNVRSEHDPRKRAALWDSIDRFEMYARGLVERKEVSIDVLAKNSSYTLWTEDYKRLKSQMRQLPPPFPSLMDVEVVPFLDDNK